MPRHQGWPYPRYRAERRRPASFKEAGLFRLNTISENFRFDLDQCAGLGGLAFRIVMYKYLFAVGSITALLSVAAPNAISRAQAPPSQDIQRSEVLADIQKLIIRSIGAQENTVEVTVSSNVVTVARVNSNMNDTTHSARDNEATAIAAVVTKAITGRPEFKNIISLRVQYLVRSAVTENGTIIDTIEFREDPKGQFHFHKT